MALLREGAFILKLSVLKLFNLKLLGLKTLATKNKTLLIRWYALHNLHLLLHVLHDITRRHFKLDCFAGKRLHGNLQTAMQTQDEVQR